MSVFYGLLAAGPGVILAAAKTTKSSSTNTWIMWVLIAVMLGVFYFILIRPQRKRAQEHDQMVNKLEKGDEVVTIGGMHGVIKRITDDSVVLEVAKGTNITFSRSAIARSLTVHEPEPEEEEDEEEEEYLEEDSEELEDELEEELEEEAVEGPEEPDEPTEEK
jgi:preprotein translocase subunit YajC